MRISKNLFLLSYGLEDRAAKDGHIAIVNFIIFVHIIMSGQEELEVFLFAQSYMLKVFFCWSERTRGFSVPYRM